MRCWLSLLFAWGLLGLASLAAQPYILSGFVYAEQEALPGVSVYDTLSQRGVFTNSYGFFSLQVPGEQVVLVLRAAGYQDRLLSLRPRQDTSLQVGLQPRTLAAVNITAPRMPPAEHLGKLHLSAEQVQRAPALLGEADLIKRLALLPGVSLAIEGSSGLIVRGASPGQNLLLLDGATVFNPTHLLGIISVFNVDALQGVDLYKGGFPARFGGRLAAILDIKQKEGSTEKFRGKVGVGLLASRLLVEGPLRGGKGSYLLAGRASYLGLLALPFQLAYRNGSSDESFNYWLYDFNGKWNYRFSPQKRLYASFYAGQDFFPVREGRFGQDETLGRFSWYNQAFSLRYTEQWGQRAFWSNQLTLSRFRFLTQARERSQLPGEAMTETLFRSRSGLLNGSLQSQLDLYPGRGHHLNIGLRADAFRFRPSGLQVENPATGLSLAEDTSLYSQEGAIWLEDEWQIGSLSLQPGLRLSTLWGETSSFFTLEPRISASLQLAPGWAVLGGWSRQAQYQHLLTATNLGLPGDVWIPASASLPPQRGYQLAAGLEGQLIDGQWHFSLEGYYREAFDQLRYLSPFIEDALLAGTDFERLLLKGGRGEAYGAELYTTFSRSAFSLDLGYSLGWSWQQFPGYRQGQRIPDLFDQRHRLDFLGSFELDEGWQLSLNWVLQSGRPVYLPVGRFQGLNGQSHFFFPDAPLRMPWYHRLDVGFQYKPAPGRTWSFGVYNLYNRRNPLFLELDRGGASFSNGVEVARRPAQIVGTTVLPFLPYLSYSWEFGL